jgi:excisionase family DNA binding protein
MSMTESPHLLTTRETAVYLRISLTKAYELITIGEVPAAKVGGVWRVPRAELDRRLAEQIERRRPQTTA